MMAPYDVVGVEVVGWRALHLRFADNSERTIDLRAFLTNPILRRVRDDDEYFARVRVDPESGTIVWPDGEDLAPDVLHGDGIPARLEQSRTTP